MTSHGFILKNGDELVREREKRNLFQSIFMATVPYESCSFKLSAADEFSPMEDLKAGYVSFWDKASSLLVVVTMSGLCMKFAMQVTHVS